MIDLNMSNGAPLKIAEGTIEHLREPTTLQKWQGIGCVVVCRLALSNREMFYHVRQTVEEVCDAVDRIGSYLRPAY